ncbi:ATP-binding protein [Sandaracinobacter sp. RS1-74]|uniref:two-component system sensor histidine kinase NtrB n=1 Tax=Sandaracinobacteroides sayramensis TaxID=2913411 RepID=UPI001EDC2437|nr:ATP-binding protein [Sandaracinobacteroides sayramensis]MCG2840046.1 ATP-binding protein [Sandaracinobacteroides sayramensis]
MLLLAPEGRVALANSASETFLNVSQPVLVEKGWEGLFPDDSPLRSLVAEARASRTDIAAYDLLIEFIGGRRVRADVLIGRLPDREGWLALSFQPRAVTSLVDRQMGQQGAARSAVGVAAMLAHEIKNPLSGIRGAAQLLSESLDEDGQELTGLIISEVDRVRALIDRMEGFTDTRPPQLQRENIHAILGHVRRLAEAGFGKNIAFKERYDPSLPLLLGNRDALVQAFLNLLKNAVEASPPGGAVTLTTAYRQGLRVRAQGTGARVSLPLEVCVIDEGEGAPPAIADHLFEPFVSARREGTGLGLALVAKVVGDHGGIVEYDRREGQTLLRVLLPLAPEMAQ